MKTRIAVPPRMTAQAVALALPTVDVVVPVHNEARVLAANIRRLHALLASMHDLRARIVIAENGSSDATAEIAAALTRELRGVLMLRLGEAGRGRALRAAWSQSTADVVAYMDVDLSTDVAALPALIDCVVSGTADVAIGSRLAEGAAVQRSRRREWMSRSYNRLVRRHLGLRTRDAQCGFKAMRADVARRLLPAVVDDGWFFDTELLYRAHSLGLRIDEVPVRWVEDRDSRVRLLRTALDDWRGIRRLEQERSLPSRQRLRREVLRFCSFGVVSTLAYLGLFDVMRGALGDPVANGLALAVTAVANTAVNRRFTWNIRGAAGRLRAQLGGAVTFLLALLFTSGALLVLRSTDPAAPHLVVLGVLLMASVLATGVRFLVLRTWIVGLNKRLAT